MWPTTNPPYQHRVVVLSSGRGDLLLNSIMFPFLNYLYPLCSSFCVYKPIMCLCVDLLHIITFSVGRYRMVILQVHCIDPSTTTLIKINKPPRRQQREEIIFLANGLRDQVVSILWADKTSTIRTTRRILAVPLDETICLKGYYSKII